jgi:hypothetical protein
MEFGDIVTKFNIDDAIKHPLEERSVFGIDVISELVDDTFSEMFPLEYPSLFGFDDTYSYVDCTVTNLCTVCAKIDAALQGDMFPTGKAVVLKLFMQLMLSTSRLPQHFIHQAETTPG